MAEDLGDFKSRHAAKAMGRDRVASEVVRRLTLRGVEGLSNAKARLVVDEVFEVLAVAMQAGKHVEIRGFGSFRPVRKNQRRTFVPTKGKVVRVDARWVVRFDAGKSLKRELMESLEG
jgi:nucleoid DNA-binding protein